MRSNVQVGVFSAVLSLHLVCEASAQAYPPGADLFVASASALAKSAGERVDLGRANARLN